MAKPKRSAKSVKLHQREEPEKLQALNISQGQYMAGIQSNTVTFGLGSAGTGKSYCATALAGEYLYQGLVDKVVVTRPAVESGRGLGYLKGDLEEKFAPYIKPVKAIFIERFGKGWYESQIKNENILIEPLEYLQGQTFDNAFILLDEAENATEKELYILLTRIGVNSKIVLNGDIKQSFVRDSGLESCMNRIGKLDDVFIHQFTSDDVVRSDIVRNIIKAYES